MLELIAAAAVQPSFCAYPHVNSRTRMLQFQSGNRKLSEPLNDQRKPFAVNHFTLQACVVTTVPERNAA
jgi:hypothetical protein